MSNQTSKVTLGMLVLAISSVVLLGVSFLGSPVPVALAALAALGMAAGSLLVGTSESGRPV
ncbi:MULTISPECIES: hypothetical protein [unclassified Haladaptatus]|uniref:hypothetical protein n=1 Tax=unclassified Haladaptatus TaxID=2622732 RepID=UPI0023E88A87|nr:MULTISPECIES: hypothetical protein [unclassified Haladaptatus]